MSAIPPRRGKARFVHQRTKVSHTVGCHECQAGEERIPSSLKYAQHTPHMIFIETFCGGGKRVELGTIFCFDGKSTLLKA